MRWSGTAEVRSDSTLTRSYFVDFYGKSGYTLSVKSFSRR